MSGYYLIFHIYELKRGKEQGRNARTYVKSKKRKRSRRAS
jgi:hypothetical protein